MSDGRAGRGSSLVSPPDQEVASRMALLAALALVAGVLAGVFAAIVVVAGGLALLAIAAAARVNRAHAAPPTRQRRRESATRVSAPRAATRAGSRR